MLPKNKWGRFGPWKNSYRPIGLQQTVLNLPAINMTISRDSLKNRLDASFLCQRTGGQWQKEGDVYICVLELKAAHYVIRHLSRAHASTFIHAQFRGSVLHKQTTGSHFPNLLYIALEILKICISRHILLTA